MAIVLIQKDENGQIRIVAPESEFQSTSEAQAYAMERLPVGIYATMKVFKRFEVGERTSRFLKELGT